MEEKDMMEYHKAQDRIDELNKPMEIVYDTTKDFYKGIRGELRFKAEGLFKKAKEKGISIEDIEIETMKEEQVEVPGLGNIALPTYIVKVRGKILENEQSMVDGKQINFYNRYQKYIANKLEEKNLVKDEKGKVLYANKKPTVKQDPDLSLSDWEKFEIGKLIVEDKEFGVEKTITGACDRVIRKLMGENDWLYPGEAKLLEEEFNEVDKKVVERETQRTEDMPFRKASDRQINYFKSRIRNFGLDPEDSKIISTIIELAGMGNKSMNELSISDMSKLIDSVNEVIPLVRQN